jgi:zinc/manganese transport system permease protein
MTIHDFLISPFEQYGFMRRALAACALLSLSGTPLGIFMNLRRMALLGDAMSHAILPGVALAFLCFGMAVWPMTLAGITAGALVALLAVFLTRFTQLKEDSSFTVIYLMSIAGGVTLVSLKGSGVDLMHLLFGNILAIDDDSLRLVTVVMAVTVFVLAGLYRGLVIDCFDPDFLRATRRGGGWIRQIFFILLVINLIAAFQALGTLMALGLMLLPAIATRFWTRHIDISLPFSVALALLSSYIGLLVSYHTSIPAGPAVVLAAGALCILSICVGRYGSLRSYIFDQA